VVSLRVLLTVTGVISELIQVN